MSRFLIGWPKASWRTTASKKYLASAAYFAVTILILLAYTTYIDDSLLPKHVTHGSLAHWFQPWSKLPWENNLYQDSTGLKKWGNGREGADVSDAFFGQMDLTSRPPSDMVSCQMIDGNLYPTDTDSGLYIESERSCQSRYERRTDVEPRATAYPGPSFGLLELSGSRVAECLTSDQRYGMYSSDGNESLNGFWKTSDLANLQNVCVDRNQHRFRKVFDAEPEGGYDQNSASDYTRKRTAIVIRAYDDFRWKSDDITNLRAMIAELTLWSGGQYQVFILLHIKDSTEARTENNEELGRKYLPLEVRNIAEIWSYDESAAEYPNVGQYDVFHQTWIPIQMFALRHPEFEYVWNWELDIRSTSHYGRLLTRIHEWTSMQRAERLEERNNRLYQAPAENSSGSGKFSHDAADLLVGDVDLITLFPVFDPAGTVWFYSNSVINYQQDPDLIPRRATIGTQSRLSRRLLMAMHEENKAGRAMFSEMFPTTMAYQRNLTTVFAPHPLWLDRKWPSEELRMDFDSSNGIGPRLGEWKDARYKGFSWYFNAELPLKLYSWWISDPQLLCLPGMLLHPVKSSDLED